MVPRRGHNWGHYSRHCFGSEARVVHAARLTQVLFAVFSVGLSPAAIAGPLATLRIVDVDASPAVQDSVPALRVTMAEGVSWGMTRCGPPQLAALCTKVAPPQEAISVRMGGTDEAVIPREYADKKTNLRTAWLVLVDAGAPVAPRWQDLRSAAFAWLEAVPREGDLVGVAMLGETKPVSRTPWIDFASRQQARDALGQQALPLMALGRDEALGPVVQRAVADALLELPVITQADELSRLVVGVFTDGRTRTAQAALEGRRGAGVAGVPDAASDAGAASTRSRRVEFEVFWFPHALDDPRADGSSGVLALTTDRGRVHKFASAFRPSQMTPAAALARRPSETAIQFRVMGPAQRLFPSIPRIEALASDGAAIDIFPAGSMPLTDASWPLPQVALLDVSRSSLRLGVPLRAATPEGHRWRVFWMPTSDETVGLNPGAAITRASIEALVATDRELVVTATGDALDVALDGTATLARSQESLDLVVFDDVTERATPLRRDLALHVEKSVWTSPLIDGPRVVRVTILAVTLVGLASVRRRRRRESSAN